VSRGKVVGRIAFLACVLALLPTSGAGAAVELPSGPHRDLVYGKCRTCHDLQYLKDSAGITEGQWEGILQVMKGYGLELSDRQRSDILDYLSTYLGPNPPPAETKTASWVGASSPASGRKVFASQCASCHQDDGLGQTGEFPPLAGNEDLFLRRELPVLVVLNGLQGRIEVNGQIYDGEMPTFAFLSDAKVAAVVNYIRDAWGNNALRPAGMAPVGPADVGDARKRKMSPQEVHAYRARQD
jgi:mono/diheme cytochrome c family protein